MSAAKVDAYIEKAQPFAQPILRHVREIAHRALPGAEEALKWGVPHFVVNGKNAVGMAAFKSHASVMLCSKETDGSGMGNFGKLTSVDDLPDENVLIARFKESAEAAQDPKSSRPEPKAAIPMPKDFASALATTAGAQEVFDRFTDAQRRDYLDWVTSAKREATRAKRVATAAEWIGDGKKRNWKYENC